MIWFSKVLGLETIVDDTDMLGSQFKNSLKVNTKVFTLNEMRQNKFTPVNVISIISNGKDATICTFSEKSKNERPLKKSSLEVMNIITELAFDKTALFSTTFKGTVEGTQYSQFIIVYNRGRNLEEILNRVGA